MATEITFRRGSNDPTSGSGLTLAEPAFNTTLKTFHIGLGHGITAAWVGAPISGLSAEIAAGITYKIPTLAAVKNYIGGLCYGNTGAATITQYVSSFNGLTGAVQGVSSVNGFTGAITVSGGTGISLNSSSNSITVNTTVLPTNTFALDIKHLLMAGTTNGNSSLLADNNLVYKPNLRTLGAKNGLSISGLDANYGEVNTIQLGGNTASGINVYTATNTVTLKVAAYGDFTKLAFETGNEENSIEILTGTITFADYLTDFRTYYLPDASGTVALTSQLMGAVNGSTAATTAVTSFNGLTGAVGGVCAAQANTFTALQTFSSGLTATGITTGSITNNSSISVTSKGGTVTLRGITSGTALVSNSITLSPLTTTNLSLNSATGIVDVNRGWEGVLSAYSSGLKFVNYDEDFYYSNTLMGNASADRTIYLPDASGTLALTSQLMGAVNGSTAATTAVTSFNGLTGAVGGVCAAQANTFTALQSFTAGISASGGMTLDGGKVWHSLNDGPTSGLDAGQLYGVTAAIYASSLSTGLLYGGLVTINAGNSAAFDVSAGAGYIVTTGATFTAEPTPVITRVSWTAKTGVTLSGLTAQDTTWIYFDSNGNLNQQPAFFTDDQVQSSIAVGALVHPSRAYISLAKTIPNVSYATDKQYEQFIRAFGPLKVSGHTIQANGANLKLNRTSGTAFILGRNYPNDPNNPSVISDNAQTDCTFWRYYRGATAGSFVTVLDQTAIDPENYDDGTGTLNTIPSNKPFTIQRLFFFPGTPSVLGVYYGRGIYASMAEAANNVTFEDFTEITNTATNAVFAGYLLVKKGTTNLTTAIAADDARIIQSGQFRSTTSGGGAVSTNLDSLNDVIISSVQDDDVLIYDIATSQWLNTPLQHIGVTRVNGLTGAVQAVSSFNGATGAVTGVTVGGANTFTALNSFNAGISAAGGTFSAPTRFTAGISASGGITFNSDVTITNTLNVSSIVSDGQVSIEDTSNARVSIGDYNYNANSTYIFLRDAITTLHLSNPFGTIDIGDPNGIDSGNYISYSATDSTLYGNFNSLNGFSDLSTNYVFASLGISAAGGVTFSGTVSSDTGYRITSSAINAQTGTTYTFLSTDNGKIVTFNNGSAVTVTIPTGLPTGFNCTAIQLGTGQVGFTAASGLTMNSYGNQYRLIGQHASASIIEYTANTVNLSGNLVV